ncbi:MAG: maleylpyruvate isomerase N-terminal domain-containing protein [Actinophytocola sp.]|uniref:maleylpyruvate isomerase N-terminal domain-containing protein n=1 Tax=Actinophytocola sp. TaxID=1872138 RepID=UPI003D6AF12C
MTGRALVDYGRLLEVLEVEGELLASSALGADPHLPVRHAEGMTLGETVRHVGSVYRMVVAWLRSGTQPTRWQRAPIPGQTLVEYLRAGHRDILAELSAHDPADGAPTWWPLDQTYGFWCRRLAHETTVHRYDVQDAAAAMTVTGRVSDEIALDGIDEVLSLWFTHRLGVLGVTNSWTGRVAVAAGRRRWIAQITASGTSAWPASADEPVEATVFSDPAGMYLWLWGRRSIGTATADGDPAGVDQLWHLLRLATH